MKIAAFVPTVFIREASESSSSSFLPCRSEFSTIKRNEIPMETYAKRKSSGAVVDIGAT